MNRKVGRKASNEEDIALIYVRSNEDQTEDGQPRKSGTGDKEL